MHKLFKTVLFFILIGSAFSLPAMLTACYVKEKPPVLNEKNKIKITPDQLIKNMYSAANSTDILLDNDLTIGYQPGKAGQHFYPIKIIVDLLGTYHVTEFQFADAESGSSILIRSGKDLFKMKLDSTMKMNGSGIRTVSINRDVNFIEFEIPKKGDTGPAEIMVFGTPVNIPTVPVLKIPARLNFENMVGFNANSYIPPDLFWKGNTIRQYEYLDKTYPALGELRVNPSLQGGTFYDNELKVRKDSGFIISPCFMRTPEKIFKASYDKAGVEWNVSYRPTVYGADVNLPASYKIISEVAYQFAARYGRATVPPANLTINVNPDENGYNINEKKSGLDLLQYLEFGNEQDRWWADTNEALKPFSMAAQNSALYDGHEGSVSNISGMKRADPSMKVVMPGLANINVDYIKLMYYWAKKYRKDGKFPADVVNFHYYPNTTGDLYDGSKSKAICPEKDHLKERIDKFADFVLRYMPGLEIWWSEFGYDTNMQSPFGAENDGLKPLVPEFDTWRLQCAWLLRTYFEGMSTGKISKFICYEMMNEHYSGEVPNDTSWQVKYTGQFGSSGLTLGEYGKYNAKTTPAIQIEKDSGIHTFIVNAPIGILRFKKGSDFEAKKKGDDKVVIKGKVISYSGNTLVVKINTHEGKGSSSDWAMQTPFAKKTSWFGMNNCMSVLAGCKFVADSSNEKFRIHKWSDGKHKNVFVVWSPTQTNMKFPNQKIMVGGSNCTYKDVESKTGATTKMEVVNGAITTTVTEMPKIFYTVY